MMVAMGMIECKFMSRSTRQPIDPGRGGDGGSPVPQRKEKLSRGRGWKKTAMGCTLVCGAALRACNLLPFSLCQTTWKGKKGREGNGADSGTELPAPQAGAMGCAVSTPRSPPPLGQPPFSLRGAPGASDVRQA